MLTCIFLSLVYSPLSLPISLSIQIDAYLFQPNFLYLSQILIYPPVSIFISFLSTIISLYLFVNLPISFNPIFFISSQSSSVHLYLFLSLFYPPLSLYISLSIQIDAYLFQPHFLSLSLILIYSPVSIFISFLSTIISFYRFVNKDRCLSLSIPFSFSQPNPHLSTCIYFYLFSILDYIFLSLCQSSLMSISFNPIFFLSA